MLLMHVVKINATTPILHMLTPRHAVATRLRKGPISLLTDYRRRNGLEA